jgi:tetratricopeptide (TPR) repeat protein
MGRPSEQFKALANRVARLADSAEGRNTLLLLRWCNLLGYANDGASPWPSRSAGEPARAYEDSSSETKRSVRVGIWERKTGDYFARAMDVFPEWGLWANVGRIEKKGRKLRVVLVGESVARGYLYDPQFNLAMVLTKILQRQLGNEAVEVVDLARTNLGLEVEELAISALLLEPDAVIIFSGNNWSLSRLYRNCDIPYIDAALRDQGIPGLKRLIEERLRELVRGMVGTVASAYQRKGVRLIWTIPEFNLGDWRDPKTNAAYLADELNWEWILLSQTCEQHLQSGDLAAASEYASKMVELDQSTNAAGLYVKAEFSRRLGDAEQARHYFELARDAAIWDPSQYFSPRVYSAAQQVLRQEANRCGNELLDLPELFKDHLGSDLPDRRIFLDYCHLTAEGIQLTAAGMASRVLRVIKGVDVPWRALLAFGISPTPQVEAETAFLAAIHNAHFWQRQQVVQHHCQRAVSSSSRIAKLMLSFAELQLRNAPMLMCRAAEQIAEWSSPSIQNYLLGHNNQQLDRVLLDAIVATLKPLGIDCRERFAELLRDEHSVVQRDIDLLDYYYCSAALQEKETVWMTPREGFHRERMSDYYKAYWIESKFTFVGQSNRLVNLRLTCRLPTLEPSRIAITVNGAEVATLTVGAKWASWDIAVPAEVVSDGVNEVLIHWPRPRFADCRPLESAAEDLTDTFAPEFFAIFGEIHSFVASNSIKSPAVVRS